MMISSERMTAWSSDGSISTFARRSKAKAERALLMELMARAQAALADRESQVGDVRPKTDQSQLARLFSFFRAFFFGNVATALILGSRSSFTIEASYLMI